MAVALGEVIAHRRCHRVGTEGTRAGDRSANGPASAIVNVVRRKVVQDYANKVCEIFTGWRLAVHEEDIPRLIELGAGELTLDLLDGTMTFDGTAITPLGIAGEITAWLQERLTADRVQRAGIESARLVVRFSATERTTRRSTFIRELKFACRSRITTDEKAYEGAKGTDEIWSKSFPESPWVVES